MGFTISYEASINRFRVYYANGNWYTNLTMIAVFNTNTNSFSTFDYIAQNSSAPYGAISNEPAFRRTSSQYSWCLVDPKP